MLPVDFLATKDVSTSDHPAPSSAALLSPVISQVMGSTCPEVSKGNNTSTKLSGA